MKQAYRLLIILVLLSVSVTRMNAQNFSVLNFSFDEMALTPIVLDQNGNKCALIKVETTATGFSFDAGQLGVREVQPKTAEIWVFVPAGVKRISIFHPKYGAIRDYDLGITLQAARTYILKLKTPDTSSDAVTHQWVLFKLNPSNAMVYLEGEPLVTDGGVAQKFLKFGSYRYSVKAANYHTQEGTICIDNPESRHELAIKLLPAFGYITVPNTGTLSSATVAIDDKVIGTTPITAMQLVSGTHSILVTRPKYKSVSSTISIEDGKTFTFDTPIQASFKPVTITGVEGSEIWVNGVRQGTSPWTGDLEYGHCLLECRKDGHRPSSKSIEFDSSSALSITLVAPVPIYGGVSISSSPALANVFIDGKPVGETPLALNKVLIGPHEIRITKTGYADFTQLVTISEGKSETLTARLSSTVPVKLSTNVQSATITLDNQQVASLSSITSLSLGQHTITISATGCKPLTQSFVVTQDGSNTFAFSPERLFDNQTITVNGVSFKMIAVEGGTFYMGSSDGAENQKPVHKVTLSSYHIGETEVTQELWKAVMGKNPSYFKRSGLHAPVEQVSWNDCQEFISRLNSLTGKHFRLPTEAEWEYASRGGNRSKGYKYSGSNDIDEVAWYTKNSESKTHTVKTKAPNELGIYDMSGNVWEWCNDWYGSYSSSNVTNPTGPSSASYRVGRGGSWSDDASRCTVSNRLRNVPTFRYDDLGLRLAF